MSTTKRLKFIGIWTHEMMNEPSEVREYLEKWLADTTIDDWFYSVELKGKKYFIADNGEFGYTAMLPEEY